MSNFEQWGHCHDPITGRKMRLFVQGVHEYDVNAATITNVDLRWEDSGDELTADECNEPIEENGSVYYRHEYALEFATWTDFA